MNLSNISQNIYGIEAINDNKDEYYKIKIINNINNAKKWASNKNR